jgi:hypothetical protein
MVRISFEYRFGPRSVLVPGDRFRVKGGPVYVTDDGRKIVMSERGIFTFQRFCQSGSGQWLEAWRQDGTTAVLYVGKSRRSRTVPNLRRRPYRVTGKVLSKVGKMFHALPDNDGYLPRWSRPVDALGRSLRADGSAFDRMARVDRQELFGVPGSCSGRPTSMVSRHLPLHLPRCDILSP